MVGRALESGVPFTWFTGDEVYGSDRKLRLWLERQEIPHVTAIKSNKKLLALNDQGPGRSGRTGSRLRLRTPGGPGAAPVMAPRDRGSTIGLLWIYGP